MTGKRICAFSLAVSVIFLILCSFILTVNPIPHECTGDDCIICCRLETLRKKADILSSADTVHCFFAPVYFLLLFGLCLYFVTAPTRTLVRLKVKLSD